MIKILIGVPKKIKSDEPKSTSNKVRTVSDVLHKLDLTHLESAFTEQGVTSIEDLVDLTMDELKDEIGMLKIGERKRIMRFIHSFEKPTLSDVPATSPTLNVSTTSEDITEIIEQDGAGVDTNDEDSVDETALKLTDGDEDITAKNNHVKKKETVVQ